MQRAPDDIRSDLNTLIEESRSIFPKLASRLDEIRCWIAKKKSGLLKSKPHVLQFLEELLSDATFWLEAQLLSEEDRNTLFAQLTPTEQYWYKVLFTNWINERDPKMPTWKKNLMAGEFKANDKSFIDQVCQEIESLGGSTLNSYIADLSMATDFIASGSRTLPLCVQVTTLNDIHSQNKQREWQSTLTYWGINRALFVSFNPRLTQVEQRIGLSVFQHSDQIQGNCYFVDSIDK
ncbi:hypothetical protein [Fortiea contorta]|uniref:hypothetical protein n=1 Tax=Fortiea contorta TaxID=1892405 RepID=UPI0003489859|nr:hypothetical protein [Fortiea contorta]